MTNDLFDTLDIFDVLRVVHEMTQRHGIPAVINSDQGAQFTIKE